MKYSVLLLLGMILGCTARGECLKSHTEITWQYFYDSRGMITGMYPQYYNSCDVWQYPNGKPKNAPK